MTEVTVAVEGCCHGELESIYATLQEAERIKGIKIDLLICCGDFEAVRNLDDLSCYTAPPKYHKLKSYYKYYSGQLQAPYLTIFIGGNHEAMNHLHELYYGGWVAPNIYFLGYAGVVNYRGIRIGGLSGIYNKPKYYFNHFEYPPYDDRTKKSSYNIRQIDVERLKLLTGKFDIFLSHDWPHGIAMKGNLQQLLKYKGFLKDEIYEVEPNKIFGSPPATQIMDKLKPTYWFSAHIHTKFAAIQHHDTQGQQEQQSTKFLALDKCVQGHDFIQILQLQGDQNQPQKLQYDRNWLAILKATHHWLNWSPEKFDYFGQVRSGKFDLEKAYTYIDSKFSQDELLIPENFYQSQAVHQNGSQNQLQNRQRNYNQSSGCKVSSIPKNEQTLGLLKMLDLDYNLHPSNNYQNQIGNNGQQESNMQSEEEQDGELQYQQDNNVIGASVTQQEKIENPDEINLDDI